MDDMVSSNWFGIVVLLAVAGGVAYAIYKTGYDAGYRVGQDKFGLSPEAVALKKAMRPLPESRQNRLLMTLTLPLWRRMLGYIAIVVGNLAPLVLLFYGVVPWWLGMLLLIPSMGLGFGLNAWCWGGRYAKARERANRLRAETGRINEIELRAIVDAVNKEELAGADGDVGGAERRRVE
jgi:hypothetical protein